jgi:prevent-host-death family protein
MDIINLHHVKAQLSRLLDDVARGNEKTLAKNGKPVARLLSLKTAKRVPPYGLLKVKLKLRTGFDDPLLDDVVAGILGPQARAVRMLLDTRRSFGSRWVASVQRARSGRGLSRRRRFMFQWLRFRWLPSSMRWAKSTAIHVNSKTLLARSALKS